MTYSVLKVPLNPNQPTNQPKIMLSLYKTLVRSHVEYCSCAWNPSYKNFDKELLEKIQHTVDTIINMRQKTYEQRLRSLGLWT